MTEQQPIQQYLDYAQRQPQAEARMLQAALQLAEQIYPAGAATTAQEPLLPHLLQAALMVADMDLLAESVAATVLTDAPAHADNWEERVTEACGAAVANLVKGIDEVPKWTAWPRPKSAPPKPKPCAKCCWPWCPTSASS